MSCTKGTISGFVFYQQEAGRLQEPDLLLGLTQSQDNASFFLPGAPECHAGGEGSGEGCPHGAKSSPTTSFPSYVQPLLSSGVIYLICRVGMFQIMKASCDG